MQNKILKNIIDFRYTKISLSWITNVILTTKLSGKMCEDIFRIQVQGKLFLPLEQK